MGTFACSSREITPELPVGQLLHTTGSASFTAHRRDVVAVAHQKLLVLVLRSFQQQGEEGRSGSERRGGKKRLELYQSQ